MRLLQARAFPNTLMVLETLGYDVGTVVLAAKPDGPPAICAPIADTSTWMDSVPGACYRLCLWGAS